MKLSAHLCPKIKRQFLQVFKWIHLVDEDLKCDKMLNRTFCFPKDHLISFGCNLQGELHKNVSDDFQNFKTLGKSITSSGKGIVEVFNFNNGSHNNYNAQIRSIILMICIFIIFLKITYFDLPVFLVGGGLVDLSKDWFKFHQVAFFFFCSSQLGFI